MSKQDWLLWCCIIGFSCRWMMQSCSFMTTAWNADQLIFRSDCNRCSSFENMMVGLFQDYSDESRGKEAWHEEVWWGGSHENWAEWKLTVYRKEYSISLSIKCGNIQFTVIVFLADRLFTYSSDDRKDWPMGHDVKGSASHHPDKWDKY